MYKRTRTETKGTRKLDDLGRVVIPIVIRRNFDIREFSDVEIYVEGDRIVFQKHVATCVLCLSPTPYGKPFKGSVVCDNCKAELRYLT